MGWFDATSAMLLAPCLALSAEHEPGFRVKPNTSRPGLPRTFTGCMHTHASSRIPRTETLAGKQPHTLDSVGRSATDPGSSTVGEAGF